MEMVTNMLVLLSSGISGIVVCGIALLSVIFALVRKDAGMMVIAAAFAIPSTFVSGEWTGYLLAVRLMPLFLLGSAFFISRDEPIFAWVLPVPAVGFMIYYLVNIVASGFVGV